jgi:hypothetical protein
MPSFHTPLESPAEEARRILSLGLARGQAMTPHEQAVAAHHAGGPSVDELEARIIAVRDGHHAHGSPSHIN